MTSQAKLVVATMGIGFVVLTIALFVSMASGDGHHNDQGDGYMDMMGAMGDMDSADMLAHMREVMGDEAFAKMEQHMTDHRLMPMTGNEDMDAMMHQMMDGMMDHMKGGETGSSGPHGDHHPTITPTQ